MGRAVDATLKVASWAASGKLASSNFAQKLSSAPVASNLSTIKSISI